MSEEDRAGLKQSIQIAVEEDHIFVEEVGIENLLDESRRRVQVRMLRDSDEEELQKELQRVVEV